MSDSIESRLKEDRRFQPPEDFCKHARITSHAEYTAMYKKSIEEPEAFWREETFDGSWAAERIRDDDEHLVAVRNGAGEETKYDYDPRANLVCVTDAAGNTTTVMGNTMARFGRQRGIEGGPVSTLIRRLRRELLNRAEEQILKKWTTLTHWRASRR